MKFIYSQGYQVTQLNPLEGKLDPKETKLLKNMVLKKFDGNQLFETLPAAFSALEQIAAQLGLEVSPNAPLPHDSDLPKGSSIGNPESDEGRRMVIVSKNGQTVAYINFQWYRHDTTGRYEVVAYVS